MKSDDEPFTYARWTFPYKRASLSLGYVNLEDISQLHCYIMVRFAADISLERTRWPSHCRRQYSSSSSEAPTSQPLGPERPSARPESLAFFDAESTPSLSRCSQSGCSYCATGSSCLSDNSRELRLYVNSGGCRVRRDGIECSFNFHMNLGRRRVSAQLRFFCRLRH